MWFTMILLVALCSSLSQVKQISAMVAEKRVNITVNQDCTVNEDINGTQTNCDDLNEKIDQLTTSYNKLTNEKTQLQTSYNDVTRERDQLQTINQFLTRERDHLQTINQYLTRERDQLRTSNQDLSRERDQLETSNQNLTRKIDQLQSSYNNLLEINNNLTTERDQLQTRNQAVTRERDELQSKLKCENGWTWFGSSCYYVSTEKKSWEESRDDCRERAAHLVIITSTEEQEFVFNMKKKVDAWVGLSDREVEGTWTWLDGTPLTTPFWYPGEPNGSGWRSEDCVFMWPGASDPLKSWWDHGCHVPLNWVCERGV